MTRKKLFYVVLAALVGLFSLSACATPAASPSESQQPHTVSVTGNGVAYGAPDIVVIQIGVQSRSENPAQAVSENNAKMERIMQALGGMGVEAKDIQTTNFSVGAQQDYDPQTGMPKETYTYVVDNTLSVTLRDLSKVGEVLGKAVDAGANSIYGVNFSITDPAALESQARDKAMADARARAEQLAQAAGVTLGEPINISEYVSMPVSFAVEAAYGKGGGSVGTVPVASGQLQVGLQVNVTYTIAK